jgi:hypothetical protein
LGFFSTHFSQVCQGVCWSCLFFLRTNFLFHLFFVWFLWFLFSWFQLLFLYFSPICFGICLFLFF